MEKENTQEVLPTEHSVPQVTDQPVNQRFAELEHIINSNLMAFYAVGGALREIKNSRLYKLIGYSRFEDYCVERWDIHYAHAKRLEGASLVVDNLKSSPNWRGFFPQNESQVRPLTRLNQEQQRQVWKRVVEMAPVAQDKPKITTKLVKKIIAELIGNGTEEPQKNEKPFVVEVDDSLDKSLDKICYMIENSSGGKVQKKWVVKILLKNAINEMESKGQDSDRLLEILSAIEEQSIDVAEK